MQALSERLAYTERFIGDLTLKSVEERIASWLMVMAERSGVYTPLVILNAMRLLGYGKRYEWI